MDRPSRYIGKSAMKTIGATLFAILFIMFAVSMPVKAEYNQWEAITYTNEDTNQVEKRLLYARYNSFPKEMFLFVVPCDKDRPIAIEIPMNHPGANLTGIGLLRYYRPEWYHPRGKIDVQLGKRKETKWEAIKPEGSSTWLYITAPSNDQIIQQLKDYKSLQLNIVYVEESESYLYVIKIKRKDFINLYDSHCG